MILLDHNGKPVPVVVPSVIEMLHDVDASGLTDGDILRWDAARKLWIVTPALLSGSTVELDWNSTGWKYTDALQTDPAGTDGVEGSTDFAQPGFDDSGWSTAQAAFGWGYAGAVNTPRNTTLTAEHEIWMRHTLPGGLRGWRLKARVDNWGFIYFNGHRINGDAPSGIEWGGADDGVHLEKDLGLIPQEWIRDDFNVIAMHVQDQLTGYGSGDLLFADAYAEAAGSVGSDAIGDPVWTTVASYLNSYSDAGGGNWPSPSYRKLSSGLVIMRGLVGTGSGTVSSAMFNLPAGYRPAKYQFFHCAADDSTNTTAYLTVRSTGDVMMLPPKPSTDVDLSGVAFYAEL